ncbi:hypothetical protein ABIB57_005375 [Devosia sp. UYZn731]|uniref:hypothetical protein n=1 Tax=Devosia sp. UYZn731 TaxID=3156345 RepID=UPI00339754FE
MIKLTGRSVLGAVLLFAAGALLGSMAPLVSMIGGNQYLLKLMLQAWQSYLFGQGWWPWSIGGGSVASLAYLLWPRGPAG